VAIVGAGYSGTIQAIELLRRGVAVTLIERGPDLARGVAYGTRTPEHLLNVRASGMSALADEPDHFANWVEAQGDVGRDGFAPRRTYGAYLQAMLAEAQDGFGERLQVVRDEAVDVTGASGLRLASGASLAPDAIVLALGNLPPESQAFATNGLPPHIYVADPWSSGWTEGLEKTDAVFLIGTGLTAVDAILSLEERGFPGRMLALSRRGLLPRAHAEAPLPAIPPPPPVSPTCLDLLRLIRADASRIDWRVAVDRLRPVTQRIWTGADDAERRRFLRHLRPWWDVHRHRIAPEVATRLQQLQAAGRLIIAAGRTASIRPTPDGKAQIAWQPRGERETEMITALRIVNCTGPRADVLGAGEPLLDALSAAGRARAGPCGIGLDVDSDCRLLTRHGTAAERIFAIGPITRGAFWESVAVPDIRQQARQLAEHLATSQLASV
jgi:uncharacterized NAD(P)/FAD-binding protein YdhS